MRVRITREHYALLMTGLLVLFGPVIVLAATIAFLAYAQGFEQSEISLIELAELYVIEVVIVVVFGYLVYRLTLYMVEQRLPETLDAFERRSEKAEDQDDS